MEQLTLKALRANKGWTQAETAKKLGISTTTYSAWENDLSNVGISKVKAIADLFKVNLDTIRF